MSHLKASKKASIINALHHALPALLILKRIDRDRIQPLLPSLQVDGVPLCMDGPDQLDGPDKGQHDGEGGVDDHPGLPPHTLCAENKMTRQLQNLLPDSWGFMATTEERKAGTRNAGIQRQALSSDCNFAVAVRKKITMMAFRILNMATSHHTGVVGLNPSSLSSNSIPSILGFFLSVIFF